MQKQQPLILNDTLLIGSGNDRNCYQHPDNPLLCIKVENKYSPLTHEKPPKQNNNEFRYYQRFRNCKDFPPAIPACYGWVDTNEGRGLVFDLIRDADGSVSSPFDKILSASLIEPETAKKLLQELKQQMLAYTIIPSDLALRNMVLQKTPKSSRLVLIDGIGSRDFIKFAEKVRWIGQRKIQRRWDKFISRQAKRHPDVFRDFD